MLLALFCILAITIDGEPCNETYSEKKIDYITNNLNDANSRSDLYNIYYLGTKPSVTECLDDCTHFNYLCDTSLNKIDIWEQEAQGEISWYFNNKSCSITLSHSVEARWLWASLTPNITANEYIIDLQLSIGENGRDAGIIFKATHTALETGKQYGAYLNAVSNEVSIWYDVYLEAGYKDSKTSADYKIDYDVIYDLQVHVINDTYTVSVNSEEIYSDSFQPEFSDANYAGIYIYDYADASTATFQSFKVTYLDPHDSDDEFVCAAYVYNKNNNNCYGYYGSDYTSIENMSVDAAYDSGIIYDSCPTAHPSLIPSKSPSYSPSKSPSDPPSKSSSDSPSKSPSDSPSKSSSDSPSKSPSSSPTNRPNASSHPDPTSDSTIATTIYVVISTFNDHVKNGSEFPGRWWLWLIAACALLVTVLVTYGICRFYAATKHVKQQRCKSEPDLVSSGTAFNQVIVTTDDVTSGAMKRRKNNDALEVQHWLQNVVGFAQYFDHFINSGYESMNFIKEIPNVTELAEIGIEEEHQVIIFEQIKKLQGELEVTGGAIAIANCENERNEGETRKNSKVVMIANANTSIQLESRRKHNKTHIQHDEFVVKGNDEINSSSL